MSGALVLSHLPAFSSCTRPFSARSCAGHAPRGNEAARVQGMPPSERFVPSSLAGDELLAINNKHSNIVKQPQSIQADHRPTTRNTSCAVSKMNKHGKNSPSSRQILDIRTRIGAIIPIAAAAVVGSYQSTEYRRVDADLLAKAASSAHASTAKRCQSLGAF